MRGDGRLQLCVQLTLTAGDVSPGLKFKGSASIPRMEVAATTSTRSTVMTRWGKEIAFWLDTSDSPESMLNADIQ